MNRYIVGTPDVSNGIEADRMRVNLAGLFFYSVDDHIEPALSFAPHAWRTCCRLLEGEDWPKGLAQIVSTESGLIVRAKEQ